MKKIVEKVLKKAILKSFPELKEIEVPLDFPKLKEHGDVSSSVCFLISQKLKKSPKEVGEILLKNISFDKDFEKIEFKEPGFLNFFFSEKFLEKELKRILKKSWKIKNFGKKQKVIVEFSSPNIAKRFSIGHFRSTIVGEALCRIFEFLGYKVIRINYLGDWGTQFGNLIYQIQKEKKDPSKLSVKEMEALYVKFHKKERENPEIEKKGKEWFEKLERGESLAKKIWKECVKKSKKEFEKIYKILNVKFDVIEGESFYEKRAKELCEKLKKKRIAKESQGALILEFEDLSPAILLKSDKTTTYFSRDLAAAIERTKKFKPKMVIYEVGKEQSLHFQQLFKALEILGFSKKTKFFHLGHGLYLTKEGKISTRKGIEFHFEEIFEKAKKLSLSLLESGERKKEILQKEKEKIAEIVALGALKFNDLKEHFSSDILFDWQKVLNLKGDTGCYLQYTFVRTKSLLKKTKVFEKFSVKNLKEEEKDLLKELLKFEDKVLEAAKSFSPNILAQYLLSLAKSFNLFYEKLPILRAEKEKKGLRLALSLATNIVLKEGLSLLSINTPSKM